MLFFLVVTVTLFIVWVLIPLFARNIWGFITGQTPVILEDFNKQVYKTLARKSPFSDNLVAYTYWFTGVGHCVLLADGTVEQPHYQKQWKRG